MIKEAQEVVKSVPNVEQKVVEMLDQLQHGAVKVGEAIVQYSPDVTDAMFWVVRLNAIQNLVLAIAVLVLSAFGFWYAASLSKKIKALPEDSWNSSAKAMDLTMGKWVTRVVSSFPLVISGASLIDVWNWVAVFEPKLWLAKQIINQVLK